MLIVQHRESFSKTCVVSNQGIVLYQVKELVLYKVRYLFCVKSYLCPHVLRWDACTVILCCIKIGILCCIKIGVLCCIKSGIMLYEDCKIVLYQVK